MSAPSDAPGNASATVAIKPKLTILTKRVEFLHAARARRQAAPGFLLQARRRAEGEGVEAGSLRVGFTCSKKVGNAVARNRAKRRLRELARAVLPRHWASGLGLCAGRSP
jgi:ribonuclease P protein component